MLDRVVPQAKDLLEEVIVIATEAGKAIKDIYDSGQFEKNIKTDETPVTSADLASHHIIYDRLSLLTPETPILSEEASDIALKERKNWQRYWLVDPLDGTGEFIAGSHDFSVLIALVENHRPVMGIVYVPMTGVCYFAISGCGAYKRIDGQDSLISSENATWQETDPIKVAVSRRQDPQTVLKLFDDNQDYELVRLGGAALKSCLVAESQAHCYIRLGITGEWDTGAAQVIVEEAGGKIQDLNLQPLTYNQRETLENPNFIVTGTASIDWSALLSYRLMVNK